MVQVIPKVWGRETWLVNESEYCCKMLELNKGSSGSLHYHPIKKETFIMAKGKIKLEIDGKTFKLREGDFPVTILPGTPHRFTGLKQSGVPGRIVIGLSDGNISRLSGKVSSF